MVLPIGDVNPTHGRSWVLWIVVLANVGVFAFQTFLLDACAQARFVYTWAAIPREVLSGQALAGEALSDAIGPCATGMGPKQVWIPLLSSLFLHGNLAHLIGNLLFLVVFGDNVEDRLGHLRFLAFYLVGGVVATIVFVAVQPGSATPLVGASGAIAAILGAYLVCFPRARVDALAPFPLYLLAIVLPGVRIRRWLFVVAVVSLPAWLMLGGWFALQALAVRDQLGGLVAYEAHVAGFLAGIVLVLVLDRRRVRHGQPAFHPQRRR